MALIKCSECGKEISDKATTCPNCGSPTVSSEQAKKLKEEEIRKTQEGCLLWGCGLPAVLIIGVLCAVLLISLFDSYEPNNPNLSPGINEFDRCVKRQKAKGLSTDSCWNNLRE